MQRSFGLSVVIAAGLATTAGADLLTKNTLVDPAVIDFSQFGEQMFIVGEVQIGDLVGEDVVVTAVGDHRVGPMSHGLADNGTWNRSGLLNNDAFNGTMTITFNDGPVSAVGGFANYAPGFGNNYTMEALDADGNVLEAHDIVAEAPISTPGGTNAGAFRGIQRDTDEIHALRLSFMFNVMDDLAFVRSGGGECPADCNGDDQLNILDFICFQKLFQSGDPAADCNGDEQLNILDFICFQKEFQAGCD